MTVLIYDGTFDGLMTALYHALMTEGEAEVENIVASGHYQPGLFSSGRAIAAHTGKAAAMMEAIRERISQKALRHTFNVCSMGKRDTGIMIYRYLRKGFAMGRQLDFHLLDPDVAAIHALSKKVSRELHRLLGLTRFRLLDQGILYAPLEPDNDIIVLLAPHFAIRLPEENWIIHDVKRKKAALYNRRQWIITDLHLKGNLLLAKEERELQELWKNYFKRIAIEERKNPRLQMGNMPKKYWKYLVEKDPPGLE